MSRRIAAVIVAYNRADLLDQALTAVSKQTKLPEKLILIDNASTDHTGDVVTKHQKTFPVELEYIKLPANVGGAGGFYEGIKRSYEQGFDLAWCMDDDTIPEPDALKYLEQDYLEYGEKNGTKPAFACSIVFWTDGDLCAMNIPAPYWKWPRHLPDGPALVNSCSFVSALIPMEKVKECGYPIKDFFIWYDDVEFTSRLSMGGDPGLLSIKSRVNHLMAENKGPDFASVTEKTSLKYRCFLRNQSAVIKRRQGRLPYLLYVYQNYRHIRQVNKNRAVRKQLLKALLSGYKFSRYEIEYPQ
jgi:GT2 family glycosyltransferase